jgi:hypothetical protein
MHRLAYLFAVIAVAAIPTATARAATTCPFLAQKDLTGAMPAQKWSLISNQDGRGCIFQNSHGDTLMLTVFRNPSADRAKELYATFIKALTDRMTAAPASGIGEAAQAGATASNAARPEVAVISLSGEYVVSMSIYGSRGPANAALTAPLGELARHAVANVAASSERFGECEWLTAADADGFLDRSTLTVQRTGANSCLIFDGAANTMMVAVTATSHETQLSMMKRAGGCTRVPLPELAKDAFGEHSCSSGNTNAVSIYLWKNGRQAWILFAPTKPHAESGSVEHLKAVAGHVYGKM